MKTLSRCFVVLSVMTVFSVVSHAATITYTYDAQHRLVQSSYTTSQKEFFSHDAAGNVDQRTAITDAKYLESWLLYLSMLDVCMPEQLTVAVRQVLTATLASGKTT
jgi:hypothetical protein